MRTTLESRSRAAHPGFEDRASAWAPTSVAPGVRDVGRCRGWSYLPAHFSKAGKWFSCDASLRLVNTFSTSDGRFPARNPLYIV
jgi:hypothetical protein